LHASFDVPIILGAIININRFALGTIHKCMEVLRSFSTRFPFGKKEFASTGKEK
jgi:hypothetical protein